MVSRTHSSDRFEELDKPFHPRVYLRPLHL